MNYKARCEVVLPAIFSDGMVLQQQSKVPIWGKSDKKTVSVVTSWNNKKYNVSVNADSTWKVLLETGKSGGAFTIKISDGGSERNISNVLLGEVWLASGQSNMEMPLKGFKNAPVNNSEEVIKNSSNANIRFFNVENKSWAKPLDDVSGQWLSVSPATASGFSAAAYFFALELYKKMNVPVAIVESDWGGTVVQAWMSADDLKSFPEVQVKSFADSAYSFKNEPTGLYNAMIHPIAGYGIKGAIWYQGEQNRDEPTLYRKLFPAMVKQWRSECGIGNFPFYYVQIAPYIYKDPNKLPEKLTKLKPFVPYLREAQLQSETVIPNSGMAVLTDVGDESTIHPPDKETVGKRLSYWALAKTYGFKNIPYSGPVYKSMKTERNTILLAFQNGEGLYLKNNSSSNFEVAGSNKVFYPATAVVEGQTVRVSSKQVANPVAARYAFDAWTVGDLFNKNQLPASSFRTDDWNMEDVKQIRFASKETK
ncbi:MAG: sialate O-acetylesterase [Chitinophagaceae bacterium]